MTTVQATSTELAAPRRVPPPSAGLPEPAWRLPSARGAEFSPCRAFRYRLWRAWSALRPPLLFILLNPSAADEARDDPTVTRCTGFARRFARGGVEIVNLYAYRTTDPRLLRNAGYLIGEGNDAVIAARLRAHAGLPVVCGWGVHARGLERAARVLAMIRASGARPFALACSDDGWPRHPARLRSDCSLIPLPAGGLTRQ